MEFGIASVAAITALCYLAGLVVKATRLGDRWIPVICGCCGLLLGICAMYLKIPGFPAEDVITAAAVGTVSGLAATGMDQAVKQLKK